MFLDVIFFTACFLNNFHVLVIAIPRLSVFIALSIKGLMVRIRRLPPWTVGGVN